MGKTHLKGNSWCGTRCGSVPYRKNRDGSTITKNINDVDCLNCLRLEGKIQHKQFVCDHTKCENYRENEKNKCSYLNTKAVKECWKRLNPKGESCYSCGREHSYEHRVIGGLCRFCRGSNSRHKNLIGNLISRGAPTLADLKRGL